ncbi:PGF-pre-PGF domain-containing protein [Natrialbaceae archaeon A-CW3]
MAIPTGATVLQDVITDESEDDLAGDIIAAPSDSANGAYAYVDNDTDEIVVDLTASNEDIEGSGVSAEAFTGISDVFTLTYEGDDHAEVWLEHKSTDHVTFYDEHGDSIENEENSTRLEHNETVHIGFSVDTHGLSTSDLVIDSIVIHAEVPEEEEEDDGTVPPGPPVTPGPPDDPEPPKEPEPPKKPPVEVIVEDGERVVSIGDATPEILVDVPLESLQIGQYATLERVDVAFASETDAEFGVAGTDDLEHTKKVLREAAGSDAVGEFEIEDAPPADVVDEVTYTVSVDREFLEIEGHDVDALTLYRHHDGGEWEALETTLVDETDDAVVLEATYDGFSRYALGVDAAVFTVEDVTVDPATVDYDQPTTIEATIENTGEESGTYEGDVLVDGEVVDTVSVTVDAGERETVALEYVPREAGEFEVALEDESTMLTVTDPTPPEDDDDDSDDQIVDEPETPEEASAFGLFELGLVLVLLALAVGGLWAYRNREELPDRFDLDLDQLRR